MESLVFFAFFVGAIVADQDLGFGLEILVLRQVLSLNNFGEVEKVRHGLWMDLRLIRLVSRSRARASSC